MSELLEIHKIWINQVLLLRDYYKLFCTVFII